MKDALTLFFVLAGALFFLISAIGILRLPDAFSRIHAASKAGSLGMGLVLIGATLHFGSWAVAIKSLFTIVFIFLTAPVAAHMLGRAAYLGGARPWDRTEIDELEKLYEKMPK